MPRTNVDTVGMHYRRFNDFVRGEIGRRPDMTQSILAEYLGIEQPTLSCRLRGLSEWSFRDVLKTCEYFEVKIEEVI